ncbi:MAG: ROK family protein [Thermodesulfobacteriota bacterium]|nr:ROK family protein [Thermodesulfobacteriota bacterium]
MNILALDIGGTYLRSAFVKGCTVQDDLRERADLSSICESAGEYAETQLVKVIVEHIRKRLSQHHTQAIALGVPGFISTSNVIIASPNLPGIHNFPLSKHLEAHFNLPVTIANDALCAARGAWLLEAPPPRSLAILTLGTGVGGGLILNGQPIVGDGGTAMEIGHLLAVPHGNPCGCGKQGCLEQYSSASALSRLDVVVNGNKRNTEKLSVAAREGEKKVENLFDTAGIYLGYAVATLVLLVDVRTIRIGGGLSRSWDLLKESFFASLNEHLIPPLRDCIDVKPVPVEMIDRIGLIGAADLAFKEHP